MMKLICSWFGGRALNDKIVIYAEGSRSGVCLDAGNGGIHLIVDDPIKSDVAVFHDDVNGMEADGRIVGDSASHPCEAATAGTHGLCKRTLVRLCFCGA